MDCILYMDVLFLWSFWMNALVLLLVRQITKNYRTVWCLAAAVIGAVCSCLGITWYLLWSKVWYLLLAEAAAVSVMNWLAFGRKKLLWHIFLFLVTGAAVAGVFLSIVSRTSAAGEAVAAAIVVSGTAAVFCILLEKNSRIHWKEEHMKAKTVLAFGGKKCSATALVDTGNKLYDPFFHKPVILVDEKIIKEWVEECRRNYPERMHYIPFHSVGKENGMLEGMTLDFVSIPWQGKMIQLTGVIAAATKGSLYQGKDYQVIFHCGLLEEGQGQTGTVVCHRPG